MPISVITYAEGIKQVAERISKPCDGLSMRLFDKGWSREFLSDRFSIWIVWGANICLFCKFAPFPEEFGVKLNNWGSFKAGGLADILSS